MLITKENIDIWYNEYKEQYKRSEKYIKGRKGTSRGLVMSNRKDFESDFISVHFDNPKLSGKQLAKKMAKEEVFATSYKQAFKAAEAHVDKLGGKLTPNLITEYRLRTTGDIYPLITDRRAELFTLGKSAEEVALIISQEFFGSK